MTEDEASQTWCHRTKRKRHRGPDMVWRLDPSSACIASACAAWRWRHEVDDEGRPWSGPLPDPQRPVYIQLDDGYCGLAGRPGP